MARKNIVNLTGVVASEPKRASRDGHDYWYFKVGLSRIGHTGVDEPIVEIPHQSLFSEVEKLKSGLAVHIEGEVRTREVKKVINCDQCQTPFETGVMISTVLVNEDGLQWYEAMGQVFAQNHVYLLGTLVKDPSVWKTLNQQVPKTKYQMAVNRKDSDPGSADYPFISSYRRLAEEDAHRLQKGSQLFVDGAIQTAMRPRSVTCTCGATHEFKVQNLEIIARSTEYLNRCNFPENEDPNHWAMKEFEKVAGSAGSHHVK